MLTVRSRCRRGWLNLSAHHTLDCRLKLTILRRINGRIDTAADEHQDSADVVESACAAADGIHDEVQPKERPAGDEAAADHQ